MIRNIVFDMGGVLITWNPLSLRAMKRLGEADQKVMLKELFHETEWLALDAGLISEQQALDSVSQRLPDHLKKTAEDIIFSWWKDPFDEKQGMEELIRSLKAEGYEIWLLSNASIRQAEYFGRLPASDCFSGRITSAEEKIIKPQKEIFTLFLDRFNLRAKESLFIDDSPANVFAAKEQRFEAVVYHNDTEELKKKMRELGIRI